MAEQEVKVPVHKKPPTSKIDISDAVVVEETNSTETKKTEGSESIDQTDSYTKNLKDQKTVDLGETGKKQASEKTTIDFMSEEHITSFTASESKKAAENSDSKSNFDGKSVEDLKEEIKKAEQDSTKNFTAKDFEDIARFLIFLIDTGISSGLKWWGKDTSDTAYSLPEKKKEMLVYQLTLILTKYQAKFSIEFMFIATILLVYAPAFMKAKRRRAELKNQPIVTKDVTHVEVKKEEPVITTETTEGDTSKVNTGPKRKRGNPGKA